MNMQFERYLQMILIVLDFVVLNLLYLICQIVITKSIFPYYMTGYFLYWTISNALWLLLSLFFRTYADKVILSFETFTKRTIVVYLLWIIFIMFYLVFSRELNISRLFIVITIGFFGVGLLLNRFIYLGIHKYFKNTGALIKKVIILGYNDTAKKLTKYFEEDGLISRKLMGYIENRENIQEITHYPVLAGIPDTLQIAKALNIQEIFSTITPEQNKDIYSLMYQAEKDCIRFKIVPNLSVFITREVHLEHFGEIPILSLRTEPLDDVWNRAKKRGMDIIISFFVIVLILSWLIPLVGLLIFIESRGSVFFKQLRTGKNNRPFQCIKFTSMKPNKDSEAKQATKNDSRLTRIGKFLRKTSLDEFPQFINVLKGEMSIVGPRPHPIVLNDKYKQIIDQYSIRQFIKPGITGWAQVNGYRGETKDIKQMEKRIEYDLFYMERWTLWLDVKILFLTVYYITKGDKNAY